MMLMNCRITRQRIVQFEVKWGFLCICKPMRIYCQMMKGGSKSTWKYSKEKFYYFFLLILSLWLMNLTWARGCSNWLIQQLHLLVLASIFPWSRLWKPWRHDGKRVRMRCDLVFCVTQRTTYLRGPLVCLRERTKMHGMLRVCRLCVRVHPIWRNPWRVNGVHNVVHKRPGK